MKQSTALSLMRISFRRFALAARMVATLVVGDTVVGALAVAKLARPGTGFVEVHGVNVRAPIDPPASPTVTGAVSLLALPPGGYVTSSAAKPRDATRPDASVL